MAQLNQEMLEKEFISILILYPTIALDLLQITPSYLLNKQNQDIFDLVLELKKENKYIDVPQLLNKIEDDKLLEHLGETVGDDDILLDNPRKQFISVQVSLLENYKKRYISQLTNLLNSNSITTNKYLYQMQKINDIKIKSETTLLSQKEILENINDKAVRIKLNKYPTLDNILNLVQGDLMIVGAMTGVGKSGLLLNFVNELMNDYQCIYFNMEMSKTTIYKRIIAIHANVPVYDVAEPKSDYQKNIINNAIFDIANKHIIVEHKAYYLEDIKTVIARHKDDKKHTIVFLDHIGLIRTKSRLSLYEQTTEVAKTLRQYCLDYDCTIISACQLNRASYASEELNLSMLKDSGELENSSSKVILLYKNKEQSAYNDKYVEDMVISIVKNRDGVLGKIAMKYDKTKQTFKEEKEV